MSKHDVLTASEALLKASSAGATPLGPEKTRFLNNDTILNKLWNLEICKIILEIVGSGLQALNSDVETVKAK